MVTEEADTQVSGPKISIARLFRWAAINGTILVVMLLGVALVAASVRDRLTLADRMRKLSAPLVGVPSFEAGDLEPFFEIEATETRRRGGRAPCRGLILNVEARGVHPLHATLPRTIRADDPSEVEVVVLLLPRARHHERFYATGKLREVREDASHFETYQMVWEVRFVNYGTSELFLVTEYVGLELPQGELDVGHHSAVSGRVVYDEHKVVVGAYPILKKRYEGSPHPFVRDGGEWDVTAMVGPPPWETARAEIMDVLGACPGGPADHRPER